MSKGNKIADGSTESMLNKMVPLQEQINKSWYHIQEQIELNRFRKGQEALKKIVAKNMLDSMQEFISKKGDRIYDKDLLNELIRYPMNPDECYAPWPKPGELYACGKQEPIGKPTIFGTGGAIDGYGGINGLKDLFYEPEKRFSVRYGFVDMSKKGKFEEYIGSYPRRMLLLL